MNFNTQHKLSCFRLVISLVLTATLFGCESEQFRTEGSAQAPNASIQRHNRFHMVCPVEHAFDAPCSLDILHEDHFRVIDGKPWSNEKRACAERVVHQLLRTLPVGVFDAISNYGDEGMLKCFSQLEETPSIRTRAFSVESIPILQVSFNGFHIGKPTGYDGFDWSPESIVIWEGATSYTFYPVIVERLTGDALACIYYPNSTSRIGTYAALHGSFICGSSLDNVEHFLSNRAKWNPGPPL